MLDPSSDLIPAEAPATLAADTLSEMLSGMRLEGVQYGRCVLTPPMGVSFPAQEMARFHFVGRGRVTLRIGGADHCLAAGDAVFLPRGTAHELRTSQEGACVCESTLRQEPICETISEYCTAKGEAAPQDTILFCGSMAFQLDTLHPLIQMMPEMMTVKGLSAAQPELPAVLEAMTREVTMNRAGAAGLLARLADVVAVSIVRAWVETDCARRSEGWLAALRDPKLGRVIAAVHRDPGRNWSVAEMAAVMGVSRSVFAERFHEAAGESPLRYVTQVRMRRAADLLARRMTVDEVAARLGYGSHSAFSRAFKRMYGHPPRSGHGRPA